MTRQHRVVAVAGRSSDPSASARHFARELDSAAADGWRIVSSYIVPITTTIGSHYGGDFLREAVLERILRPHTRTVRIAVAGSVWLDTEVAGIVEELQRLRSEGVVTTFTLLGGRVATDSTAFRIAFLAPEVEGTQPWEGALEGRLKDAAAALHSKTASDIALTWSTK